MCILLLTLGNWRTEFIEVQLLNSTINNQIFRISIFFCLSFKDKSLAEKTRFFFQQQSLLFNKKNNFVNLIVSNSDSYTSII